MMQVLHEHVIAGGCTLRYLSQVRREFWERHWINEVFSFGHDLRIREVLVLNTWDPYEGLLRSVTDHGRLILLIIDERDHFPRALMRQFGAVIRVGFDYGDYPPNTLTIPLYLPEPTFREAGCRTLSSDFDSRPYLWSFAGDGHKNRERREMLSAFSPIRPGHKHIFRGWLPPIALQPRDYAALIRDSIFVPCPTGTIHVECYRAYEAAYLGAIPVVTSDYYAKYFAAPFPQAPNWHDAAQQVLELQQDHPRLSC